MKNSAGLYAVCGSKTKKARIQRAVYAHTCNVKILPGDNSEGDPPVSIPNTEVKPFCADGTVV